MVDNYIRITLRYQHGQEEEILCSVEKYPDIEVFCKHYKKFIKALNTDYCGAGLIRASAYLETDDKFVTNKGLISVGTDLLSIDKDPIETESESIGDTMFFGSLNNIAVAADRISETLNKINDKIEEKPNKKILLEDKPKKQGVKKNDKTNNKK